jgi:hypothetical protein
MCRAVRGTGQELAEPGGVDEIGQVPQPGCVLAVGDGEDPSVRLNTIELTTPAGPVRVWANRVGWAGLVRFHSQTAMPLSAARVLPAGLNATVWPTRGRSIGWTAGRW